jgi:tetratricopeptide (TPR) repeat protein
MYRRSGQARKAVEKFDKAVAVDPNHETARFNKGIVLMHDLGDRDGAVRAWEELLEINPLAMAGNNQSIDQMVKHYKEGHDKNTSN